MKTLGQFFTVSAPSGTGKTTLLRRLLSELPELKLSISCTTRSPRPGEKDGVDYHFVPEKEFREMISRGEFFEWEEVHGAHYGTPKHLILDRRLHGLDTILDIDVKGALNLKKAFPESCAIFLLPPSLGVLEERLRSRNTENQETLTRRLENAKREMGEKDRFDYVIINDEVDRAYDEMKRIVLDKKK